MYAWKKSIISLDLLRQAITIGVRTRILAPAAAPCAWNSVRWLHCAWASNRPSMWMWGHQRTRSIHADTWRLRKLSSEQLYTLLWLKYDSTNWWFTFDSCRYWANVEIPHGTNGFQAVCPFCATPLDGATGYIKLIFQDNLD